MVFGAPGTGWTFFVKQPHRPCWEKFAEAFPSMPLLLQPCTYSCLDRKFVLAAGVWSTLLLVKGSADAATSPRQQNNGTASFTPYPYAFNLPSFNGRAVSDSHPLPCHRSTTLYARCICPYLRSGFLSCPQQNRGACSESLCIQICHGETGPVQISSSTCSHDLCEYVLEEYIPFV